MKEARSPGVLEMEAGVVPKSMEMSMTPMMMGLESRARSEISLQLSCFLVALVYRFVCM